MKQSFLVLFLLGVSMSLYATHLRSAQLTHRLLDVSTFNFEATYTRYTQASSIQADVDFVMAIWGDGNSDTLMRVNGPDANSNGIPDGVVIGNNTRKSVYVGTHHYAGLPPPPLNFFIIGVKPVNRTDGILNIGAGFSVDVPLFVEDTLYISNILHAGTNSSPEFLIDPIDYGNLNDTFQFSSGAYDKDGDSLSFELVPPLQDYGSPVPFYSMPGDWCQSNGTPGNTFQINSHTGHLTWLSPCQTGIFVTAINVKEYRCGNLLSTVRRDMQMIILNEPNNPPVLSTVTDTVINPGDSISLFFSAYDNAPQTVVLEANGEALLLNNNSATFQFDSVAVSGTLNWKPDAVAARRQPYIFSVVAKDDYQYAGTPANLNSSKTFRVWVNGPDLPCFISGIQSANSFLQFEIFPNPATNQINISIDETLLGAQLNIYNTAGVLVRSTQLETVNSKLETSPFTNGIYIAEIKLKDVVQRVKWVKM